MITFHRYDPPSAFTWYVVIQGMRNSWCSWEKSDSWYDPTQDHFVFGSADKELAARLTKAGTDHGKYLRQLPIILEFTAPEYFLKEFDTYKVSTTRNSTSMMHTLGREPFDAGMFSWEDMETATQADTLHTLNTLRQKWIDAGRRKGSEAVAWRAVIQATPQSWNYRSVWSGNYQVLRHMYHARKNHRLREWRDFCSWVEQLPYAELITI